MHDPLTVAHEIKYPWRRPTHFGKMRGSFLTIWHRDPSGYDSGERCQWKGRWRWHIHHWRFQLHPYQRVRTAFNRCEGCGKRFGLNPGTRIGAGWDSPASYHYACFALREVSHA